MSMTTEQLIATLAAGATTLRAGDTLVLVFARDLDHDTAEYVHDLLARQLHGIEITVVTGAQAVVQHG